MKTNYKVTIDMNLTKEEKKLERIQSAKEIIAEIYSLFISNDNGYMPKGYGNYELNKATDAMYAYIKELENI